MRRLRPAFVVLAAAVGSLGSAASATADDKPKIRAVTPSSGFRGTVVDVALEGVNLHPREEVKTNRGELGLVVTGVPTATKVVVRLTIPDDAPAGPVAITIRTKAGVVTTEKFVVKTRTPVVTKLRPDALVRGQTHDLVATGSNLVLAGRETRLSIDAPLEVKALGKPTDKEFRLQVVVPATAAPGPKTLVFENDEGKVSVPLAVLLAPPSVAKPGLVEVERAGTTSVSLSGANLGTTSAVVTAIPDPEVEVAADGPPTATSVPIRVTASAKALPGPRILVVRSADGYATVPLLVKGSPPALAAAEPPGLARGTSADVKLGFGPLPKGAGFGVTVFPADPAIQVVEKAPGLFTVTVGLEAGAGARTLVASHPWGLGTTPFAVGLRLPSVTGVTPSEVAPGSTVDVALEGRHLEGGVLVLGTPDPALVFTPGAGGLTGRLEVKADAKPGPRAIAVRTTDGFALGFLAVKGAGANAPFATSALPGRVLRGAATKVVVAGSNLLGASVVATDFAGAAVPAKVERASATSVEVLLEPSATTPLGGVLLALATADGVTAASVAVLAAPPVVASVAPATLARGATAELVVTGTGLAGPGGTAPVVTLGFPGETGVPATVASASAERLVLKVDGRAFARAGSALLTVTTPDGGVAAVVAVEGAPPFVESVAPVVVGTPATVELTVTGKHLVGSDGKPASVQVTQLGAQASLSPLVLKSSPTALVVRVATTSVSPAGPHVLRVKTVDGESSGLFAVVPFAPPVVQRLAPAVSPRNGGILASITGTGLAGATSVTFSGTGVTAVILPGTPKDTELQVRITVAGDAAPGERTMTVTGPGGAGTNPVVVLRVE